MTKHLRSGIAGAGVASSLVVFVMWFMTGLRTQLTQSLSISASGFCDAIILAMVMASGWLGLSYAIRFLLQKKFPKFRVPLNQKIGKTGQAMLGGIFVAFIMALFLVPVPPAWFDILLHGR